MKHINPFTGEETEIKEDDLVEIKAKVGLAKASQKIWRKLSLDKKIEIMEEVSSLAKEKEELLARTITEEMGKPLAQAKDEVKRFSNYINFYKDNVKDVLKDEKLVQGFQYFEPVGVVAVISPWNFPVGVPVSGIVPALLSGNSVIFKPSEYTPGVGKLIVDIFKSSPLFPKDLLQIVVGGKEHGKELVRSNINMIHFTGSTSAGKHIMKEAASGIKRVLLELGGMDASLVLEDTNVKLASKKLVRNSIKNAGQICCAVKRVYVQESIFDKFVEFAKKEIESLEIGDPTKDVDMGPQVASFQKDKLIKIREDAISKGASVFSKACSFSSSDNFFEPTLVFNLSSEMSVMNEEPFGPILPIIKFKTEEEAIKLANDSKYGLTASVFSEDIDRAKSLARDLEAGSVSINDHAGPSVGCPFGGHKESGIGFVRSKEALKQFCNIKYINVCKS